MIFPFSSSAVTYATLTILLGLVSASPSQTSRQWASRSDSSSSFCSVSAAVVDTRGHGLPFPQYNVTQIGLGIGTQNYSCSSAGTYTSIGALAELFDISCEYGTAAFRTLPAESYRIWSAAPVYNTVSDIIDILHAIGGTSSSTVPAILGEHYFVPNPSGSGLSPKWDFTSEAFAGNDMAFVIAKGAGDIPSPLGSENVDWLYLTNVEGELAHEVYRIDTFGGQPPKTVSGREQSFSVDANLWARMLMELHSTQCTPGSSPIVVKYTALYCK
ncbi:hypothetical protein BT96DRAFT_813367 [Gymnopus androsaceus JB14]|uniref:Malate dehydrogenase n=1 Tax=Gymnopus androsaceus JB14 TaxID=1447944 RepID=A0A6A4I3Y6_9AGAR|nr:hypothetical protein BT96DRAFT_813367 [Gymnopus androsaceus JB14]